jgi:hypothetical protein
MRYLLVLSVLFSVTAAWAVTAEEEAKLLASDGADGDSFGSAVAVFGDTAIVGAAEADDNGPDSGSAYVFMHAGGAWLESTQLLPADGVAGDLFGSSAALDGDTAIIGAREWANDGSGSAYVFTRTCTVWTEEAKLFAPDGGPGDRFGVSVSLDGDTVLIGADSDVGLAGSAYVFVRTGGAWVQQAKLVASDGASQDHFGISVALDGNTAVIGAWLDDDHGNASGSAYVFTRAGSVWTERAKLVPDDGEDFDKFGRYVALDGNTALIGAYEDDDRGFQAGSVYVYTGSGSVWTVQAKLLAADGAIGDNFGRSVALDGEIALIGAYAHDDTPAGPGAAYVFLREDGLWTQQAKLLAADGADGDELGTNVALDGDTALVGADGDDDNGPGSGAAYVFRLHGLDDDIVPATGIVGSVLLLVLLGAGGYVMRRRPTT